MEREGNDLDGGCDTVKSGDLLPFLVSFRVIDRMSWSHAPWLIFFIQICFFPFPCLPFPFLFLSSSFALSLCVRLSYSISISLSFLSLSPTVISNEKPL